MGILLGVRLDGCLADLFRLPIDDIAPSGFHGAAATRRKTLPFPSKSVV